MRMRDCTSQTRSPTTTLTAIAPLELAALISDIETIFLPGAIEQRDQAMVEQVQPGAQGRPLWPPGVALQPQQQLGVEARQDAARSRHAEEVHRQRRQCQFL